MSTYYFDPKVTRADAEIAAADLRGLIENIRVTHRKAGYRMLQHYLLRAGHKVSEYKLRKTMKQFIPASNISFSSRLTGESFRRPDYSIVKAFRAL